MDGKKIMMSGIQPSGILTIGNYLGAIRNWKKLQQDFDCVYMLADLHTLTVRQDPAALRKNTMELTALYLACGLDPAQSAVFLQWNCRRFFHIFQAVLLRCCPFPYFENTSRNVLCPK